MEVNGKETPVFQESTWDAEEESMIGLIYSLDGKYPCALTGKSIEVKDSEYACKGVQDSCKMKGDCVCKGTSFSQADERCRSRTGRETGSKLGHITSKEMGKKLCAITDKLFEKTKEERWEDVRAKRMAGGSPRQGGVEAAKEK